METVANQLAIAIENARLFGMVKEREDRYRVLVESNPGAVIHLDAQGAIIFANPAALDLTGRTKEELLSADTSLTRLAVEESRSELHEAIADSLGGKPRRDVEFEIAHADGRVRSVQASFQPLLDEQGATQGVVVLAWDRTRERELQDRLYQSEKLGAIGGLVSGVAHELNNPLAGILGFAQLLLSRPTDEWTVKDVEKIEKNAKRCRNIVENLLAFARQAKLSRRMANLNEIIDSVIRLNEYQLHMDDVEIQRDLDLRLPPLHLDVNRWQQVFVNLAQNAHQALLESEGGPRVIRFETRVREGRVVVRVSDTGPGIEPELEGPRLRAVLHHEGHGYGTGPRHLLRHRHGARRHHRGRAATRTRVPASASPSRSKPARTPRRRPRPRRVPPGASGAPAFACSSWTTRRTSATWSRARCRTTATWSTPWRTARPRCTGSASRRTTPS